MANQKIQDIEGIGPVTGGKFETVGVKDTDTLLEKGATKAGRKALAEATGVSEAKILKFVNMADLYRIKGVGSEYSELLEAAGVDTVPELAQRNAANLTAAMLKVNEEKKLTRRPPAESEVARWIAQAKEMPRVIQY
jgi:predicted flap endonuclease-1-like 5' DNA nuclease